MVYQFLVWRQETALGGAIRDSLWLFPVIETFHLLALSVLGGMILVVDLRMGLGLTRQPLPRLARDVQPWLVGALAVMLVSGFLLFTSEALKCYDNGAFWMKMIFLLFALIFSLTIRRRVTVRDDARFNPLLGRIVPLASLTFWAGVGVGSRGIGSY